EETYLSAAMHVALRCLGMQVRLRVTEEGNIRCVSCTDGATIAWATRPYDEGKRYLPWPRAGVHDIRRQRQAAPSGSVGRRGESMWSRTVSPASTEQGLPGASVPVAESIETGRGTPPKDVDSAAPQKHRKRRSVSGQEALTDRKRLLSTAGIEAARRTTGRARVRLSVMTLPLLVPVRCFFCLPLLPPWQHSMALRCVRRCAARRLRFLLRGPHSALDAQLKNIHFNGSLSPYACAVWAPFDFLFEIGCISDANSSSCVVCRCGPSYSSIDCLCVC
ncbi:hypothetical protein TCSYLVIO_010170, partial [Trypanosoma cruzi]